MSNDDPGPTPDLRPIPVVTRESNSGLYFIVGALFVLVLVGAYVVIGTPGLHEQVANAPGSKADVTVQQPAAPATPPATSPAPQAPPIGPAPRR